MRNLATIAPRSYHGIIALLLTAAAVTPGMPQESAAPPPAAPAPAPATNSEPVSPPGSMPESPRDVGIMPAVEVPPAFIFFPPTPPPLDALVASARQGGPSAPPELSAYVGEMFYAPLSSLLAKNELSEKLRRRLEAYRTARDNERTVLQNELDRLRPADAATRQRALEALARQQTPRLAALEQTAEALRQDSIDGFYGWFAQRQWELGERRKVGDSPAEVAASMEGYAYYKKGLLPAQRGLLREIAMEVEATQDPTPAIGDTVPSSLFFAPHMARVQLPHNLPAPLESRIAEFHSKKSALKKDLFDAVYEQERAGLFRGNPLKSRAMDQSAQLTELERLAEEIRRELAILPSPARLTPESQLPAALASRVAAVLRHRATLKSAAEAKIVEIELQIRKSHVPVELTYTFDPTGLTFEVPTLGRRTGSRGGGGRYPAPKEIRRKIEEVTTAMEAVAEAYGHDLAETGNELIAIRTDIAATLGAPGDPTPEAALATALGYATRQEHADANRDYRTAVFELGLSPEQRRLLFGSAIEALHLPLPAGELQPTRRR
ncbi:MAG: hypothetical protein ABIZ49_03390 [Opitutaceae bacterium]